MKRILAIILCLVLMAVVPACKPDHIQPPAEIITPGEEQQNAALGLEEEQPEEEEAPAPEIEEEKKEEEEKPSEEEETSSEEQAPQNLNPLAAEDFKPSTTTASALQESGIIKNADPATLLKNRTITFYTANDTPAFTYTDEEGTPISEWAWLKAMAEEQGFTLQYQIKQKSVSVSAQRTALYAGKELSLIQLDSSDLTAGLSISASAEKYLNLTAASFGISKAVLTQSNYKLFAPIGMAESIWYNTALVGEQDPAALLAEDAWSVENFKKLCTTAAEQKILPLLMEKALPWVTTGGVAPIGLLKDQKLDTNLSSEPSKSVWTTLQNLNKEIPAVVKDEDATYSLADGNIMMEYTAAPVAGKGMALSYAPLPKLKEDGKNSVTFSGTFFALPKYQSNASANLAALLLAERWCNRYAEARAADLQKLGVKGASYQAYADLCEGQGTLILYSPVIEGMIEPFLNGLTDESIVMKDEFTAIKEKLNAYLKAQNYYY